MFFKKRKVNNETDKILQVLDIIEKYNNRRVRFSNCSITLLEFIIQSGLEYKIISTPKELIYTIELNLDGTGFLAYDYANEIIDPHNRIKEYDSDYF